MALYAAIDLHSTNGVLAILDDEGRVVVTRDPDSVRPSRGTGRHDGNGRVFGAIGQGRIAP
jgi:hypothetical protein